tara:strand:+ start:804 stop:1202 length:399 start_codon:yes stop_codon:yes gene_type:complete
MANVTRVNGNAQPQGQSGTISADALVIANGPALDFFKVVLQDVSGDLNDLRAELGTNGSVQAILQLLGTTATVEMYQVEGDTTGQISVAVYPQGVWTTSTLQAAVRALGAAVGANTVDVSGSTVTTSGLEFV